MDPQRAADDNEAAPPRLRKIMTVDFDTRVDVSPGHPRGDRFIVTVTGGRFTGPGLSGAVMHGADWATRRSDGSLALDVRAHLLTDDGVSILLSYQGTSHETTDGRRVRTSPFFSAPTSSPYDWLNGLTAVAIGDVGASGVSYEIYAVD